MRVINWTVFSKLIFKSTRKYINYFYFPPANWELRWEKSLKTNGLNDIIFWYDVNSSCWSFYYIWIPIWVTHSFKLKIPNLWPSFISLYILWWHQHLKLKEYFLTNFLLKDMERKTKISFLAFEHLTLKSRKCNMCVWSSGENKI